MRPPPITLEFGDKKCEIKSLSLGQIRRIEPILRPAPEAEPRREIDIASDIIRIGLERDWPDEAEALDDLDISFVQIGEYMHKILILGGLVQTEAGEAQAVPQTGTASTES